MRRCAALFGRHCVVAMSYPKPVVQIFLSNPVTLRYYPREAGFALASINVCEQELTWIS